MLKALAKAVVFKVAGSAPAIRARLDRSAASGRITILNFHRVAPDDRSAYQPLAPQLFDDVIGFCQRQFDLVTFADLDRRPTGDRPRAIISFDDGYADFMEHSVPILARHGVTCNHNVIPACVERGRPPHNVVLQDYVGQTGDERAIGDALGVAPGPGFGNRMSASFKARPMAEQDRIMTILEPIMAANPRFRPTPMMTLADWKEAARTHEIGAHSFEHATLAAESDDYVLADGKRCRDWLDSHLALSTPIYALPNGEGRDGVEELLARSGFTTILYTGERYATATDLNRFTMYGSSAAELRARATGWTRG